MLVPTSLAVVLIKHVYQLILQQLQPVNVHQAFVWILTADAFQLVAREIYSEEFDPIILA